MINTHANRLYKELKVDCEKCFGLCCVALYFSALEGFPSNKDAGKPCMNLQSDFTCSVHKDLRKKGLKGCTAYDCFGAGQRVSQTTFKGRDWSQDHETAKKMFEGFLVMRQLHEILWYLVQAYDLQSEEGIKEEVNSLIEETEGLTLLDIDSLLKLDIQSHRANVSTLLRNTSEMVRNKVGSTKNAPFKNQKYKSRRLDYFGADLRKTDLRGADLRGACLIAANLKGVDMRGADLIGADLRDADICGANLADSIFLTQAQINTAKGDSNTKLPKMLLRPGYWSK